MRRRATVLAVLASAVALFPFGCSVGPDFETPAVPVEEDWSAAASDPRFTGAPPTNTQWWESFDDPTMTILVQMAMEQNLDLQESGLRVVQARALHSLSIGGLLPILVGSASATHVKLSKNVRPDVKGDRGKIRASVPDGVGGKNRITVEEEPSLSVASESQQYRTSLDAAWELDIWGKGRRGIEAAQASLVAEYADFDSAAVSLAGEVAMTYIAIRSFEQRLAALHATIEDARALERAAEDRHARGAATETDVLLARSRRALWEQDRPSLEAALADQELKLALLLDRPREEVRLCLGGPGRVPTPCPEVASGIPADLLRRRPDVRMAEARAHAECARLGMVKARMLPSFSLIGAMGLASNHSGNFEDSTSQHALYGGQLGFSTTIMYPILVELVRIQDAEFEAALLGYKRAVENAASDVERSMTAVAKAREQVAILESAASAADRATVLAREEYASGKADVPLALEALDNAGIQRDLLAERRSAEALAMVSTFKALGGGWESRSESELIPDDMRERMKDRSDWWTFYGPSDLNSSDRPEVEPPEEVEEKADDARE